MVFTVYFRSSKNNFLKKLPAEQVAEDRVGLKSKGCTPSLAAGRAAGQELRGVNGGKGHSGGFCLKVFKAYVSVVQLLKMCENLLD